MIRFILSSVNRGITYFSIFIMLDYMNEIVNKCRIEKVLKDEELVLLVYLI